MKTQVYITNLGKYNEGELVGEWFEFPIDMQEVAKVIGLNAQYEEYAIHDYETVYPITINEYSNIEKLNEVIESLDAINGLKELCETLKSDYRHDVNVWGGQLIDVLNEMEEAHDVVEDYYVTERVKSMLSEDNNECDTWIRVKIFLGEAVPSHDYHILDGYNNVGRLTADYATNALNEAIKDAIRNEHGILF